MPQLQWSCPSAIQSVVMPPSCYFQPPYPFLNISFNHSILQSLPPNFSISLFIITVFQQPPFSIWTSFNPLTYNQYSSPRCLYFLFCLTWFHYNHSISWTCNPLLFLSFFLYAIFDFRKIPILVKCDSLPILLLHLSDSKWLEENTYPYQLISLLTHGQ